MSTVISLTSEDVPFPSLFSSFPFNAAVLSSSCFSDYHDFTNLYFSQKYRPQNPFFMRKLGKLVTNVTASVMETFPWSL